MHASTSTDNHALTGITLADDAETEASAPPFFPLTIRPPPTSTLFPYTTLFRSDLDAGSLTNIATADSTQTPPVTDTVTVPAEQTPALALEKKIGTAHD